MEGTLFVKTIFRAPHPSRAGWLKRRPQPTLSRQEREMTELSCYLKRG